MSGFVRKKQIFIPIDSDYPDQRYVVGQDGRLYAASFAALVHTHVHADLTGKDADDHLQYHTDARGDARYSPLGHNHAALYAPIANGVTGGDAHDHFGGDGAQIDHVNLANKGVNTHLQIDTALTRLANTSGINTGDQVVPANEPGAANNFLTAYNNLTGAWTKAQPTWVNIDKTVSSLADIVTRTHSLLASLDADDHTQYLLVNGARKVSADWYMTDNKVGIGCTPNYKFKSYTTTPNDIAVLGNIAAITGTNYGVYGQANGVGATENRGLYGYASGAATNWGLYIGAGDSFFVSGLSLWFGKDVTQDNTAGLYWHSDKTDYFIARTAGAWSGNYAQLKLKWSTGIVIDGGSANPLSGTILQPGGGNVGIGNVTAFGTSASAVLGLKTGAAPTTAPADMVQLYSADGADANTVLSVYQEKAPYAGAGVASTTKIPVRWNGTVYYLLATTVA